MNFSRLESKITDIMCRKSTVFTVEITLVVILSYIAASFVWALSVAPLPLGEVDDMVVAGNAEESTKLSFDILTAFDPFHRGNVSVFGLEAVAEAPPETSLDIKLFGIRLADGVDGGSAIIRLQNYRHAVLTVGDKVSPGITLSEIRSGYVVLSREGRRETLYLDPDQGHQPMAQQTDNTKIAAIRFVPPDVPSNLLFDGVGFRTKRDESGQISGVIISAGEGSDFYQRTELESGDVIVAVNGISVSDFGPITELRQSLQGATSISLVVERGGERRTVQLGNP